MAILSTNIRKNIKTNNLACHYAIKHLPMRQNCLTLQKKNIFMKFLQYTAHTTLLTCLVLLFPFCTNSSKKEGGENDKPITKGEQTKKEDDKKEEAQDGTKVAKKEEKGARIIRKKPSRVTPERQYNDLARFIAGMEGEEGSALASLESNAGWKSYAQSTDAQWKALEAKLPKMQQWAGKELNKLNQKGGTLFYPFAGADFLHATAFFPDFDEIVMMGLEPIGTMPSFENIDKRGAVPSYFQGMTQSLNSILQFSFFQTLHMANDFNKRVAADIDGTLPVLLFFIERTHHRILKYERVALSPTGEIVKAEAVQTQGAYYGTKITYQREGKSDEQKTIYYFAVNLGNDAYSLLGGLPNRKDLKNYIESLNITATYIKSASYLMYNESFSTIRNMILDESQYLLQDDSGMPLQYVTSGENKWDLLFYGVYAGPIPLFAGRWQNDMKLAYQKPEQVRPLPFGIGYQYREGSSNLMLATKKKD